MAVRVVYRLATVTAMHFDECMAPWHKETERILCAELDEAKARYNAALAEFQAAISDPEVRDRAARIRRASESQTATREALVVATARYVKATNLSTHTSSKPAHA